MKVGIVGFAGSGKSTVFHWLTGVQPDLGKAQFGQTGVAKVPDPRLDLLSQKFQPRKTTPASLDFLDTPGLIPTERQDNPRRLGILREATGLLVVLNGFSEGDFAGQLRRFREELLFADLEIVTNRISRLEDQLRKPRPGKQKETDQFELALLQRIVTALEDNQSPATLGLHADEEKMVRAFQLLTLKPEQVLVNQGEAGDGPLPTDLLELAPGALGAAPKLEMEIHDLPAQEQASFMEELGLTRFHRDEILQRVFDSMDRLVFFTVGYDECRAWPLTRGSDAVTGAGQIHTDLARGFIRAEVLPYAEFTRLYQDYEGRVGEHMKEARTHGVLREEGKTYVVQDGDIMHIRHST
jgi:ribosome-binding ATPase YchF (GTP1/OBG family)